MLRDKTTHESRTQAMEEFEREMRESMEAALEGALAIAAKEAERDEVASAANAEQEEKPWTHVLVTFQQEKGPTLCGYFASKEWEGLEEDAAMMMRHRAKELGYEVEECVLAATVLEEDDALRLQNFLSNKYDGEATGAIWGGHPPGGFIWQEMRVVVPCSKWSWVALAV